MFFCQHINICVHNNPGTVNTEYNMAKQECRCCYFVTEYNCIYLQEFYFLRQFIITFLFQKANA